MVPFATPKAGKQYQDLGADAIRAPLAAIALELADVQQAFASYVYGDSTCGQVALYSVGMTGIPVVNVNNNCSSGSSGLFLARQAVASGDVDVALAFGFEQMQRGALVEHWADRVSPLSASLERHAQLHGEPAPGTPMAAVLFGAAGQDHMDKFGTKPETFARIAVKARKHAANNPYAVFRDPLTLEEVLESPTVHGPLTRYQCCPPTSGGAAVVLVSADYAKRK